MIVEDVVRVVAPCEARRAIPSMDGDLDWTGLPSAISGPRASTEPP